MNSPAVPQAMVQALTSVAPLGRLKSPLRGRAETAQLHLGVNHLKRSWTCAKGILMAVGDSFLYRHDAVLISHEKREAPSQG